MLEEHLCKGFNAQALSVGTLLFRVKAEALSVGTLVCSGKAEALSVGGTLACRVKTQALSVIISELMFSMNELSKP